MAFKRSAVRSRLSPPHLSRASNGARETKETEYGGIAQLGERLNGIQEVSGSIPLISTRKLTKKQKKSVKLYDFTDFFLHSISKLLWAKATVLELYLN